VQGRPTTRFTGLSYDYSWGFPTAELHSLFLFRFLGRFCLHLSSLRPPSAPLRSGLASVRIFRPQFRQFCFQLLDAFSINGLLRDGLYERLGRIHTRLKFSGRFGGFEGFDLPKEILELSGIHGISVLFVEFIMPAGIRTSYRFFAFLQTLRSASMIRKNPLIESAT
jgi:hypothetical protein